MPITVEQAKTELRRRRAIEELARRKGKFDPEGIGYDYETAGRYGLKPDETGHWPSRVPETGILLKGRKHPTWYKTEEGEKKAGYITRKGPDGRYYSTKEDPTRMGFPRPKLPSAWDYDRQLDKLFGGQSEAALPFDVKYDFGKVVGISKPDGTDEKIANSLVYSILMDKPLPFTFSVVDQLNELTFGKPIDTKKALSEYRDYYTGAKSYVGAIKHGYRRAGVMMTKQVAGVGKMVGEFITPSKKAMERAIFPALNEFEKRQGDKLKEWSDMMLVAVEEYYTANKSEVIQIAPGIGYWETLNQYIAKPTNLVQGLVESSPLILEGILGGVFGGTVGAITTMSVPISGEVYANARAEGTEPLPAMAQAILTGTGEATIEVWTLSRKLGLMRNYRTLVAGGLPKVMWEGTKAFFRGTAEEGSQEFNRNFWRWVFTDRSQQWTENVAESMAAGGPMEMVMAGTFSAAGAIGPTISKEEQIQWRLDKIQEAVEVEPTLDNEAKVEIIQEIATARQDVLDDVYPETVEKPSEVAPEAPRIAVEAEKVAKAVEIPTVAEIKALGDKELKEKFLSAKPTSPEWVAAFKEIKKRKIEPEAITKPEAIKPPVEAQPPKITDRIDKITGVEKSYWKDQELTVYYDETVPKETINVRVHKALTDNRLMDSVKKINLLSTEKGTFALAKPPAEAEAEKEVPAPAEEVSPIVELEEITLVPEIEKKLEQPSYQDWLSAEYGLTPEEGHMRLENAERRYRELKGKETAKRTQQEKKELAWLSRQRANLEAIIEQETLLETERIYSRPFPVGLTRAEISLLGKQERDVLRAAQARGLKVGYKQGAAETITDARRSLDAFRVKDKISEKMRIDAANIVLTYLPKEKQGDYIRRILQAKTQKRIERLTESIDKYLDKAEKRQAVRNFKTFVKDIKKKYRRGEVALGQLPKKIGDAIIDVLDKFDVAKISKKKTETLESRAKFVNRIAGELSKGFEQLNEGMDKDATDLLMMGARRIDELKRLSQKYIGELDTEQIRYIQVSLEHLIKINELKGQSKERRRMENLRADINNARQEVLPAKAIVKVYTGILGAMRWLGVEGQSTIRTMVGLSTGKENSATKKLLVDELDKANVQRKETYKSFIMYFRGLLKKKGLDWPDVRNLQELTKITIGGKQIEIDHDNLLALYAHTQAEGNLRRLLKTKGLNITVYLRHKRWFFFTQKNIYRVGKPTLAELRDLVEKIPEDHKKLLEVYFKTNRDKQAPAINETSMAYQNFDLARMDKYFHLSREIERVVEGKNADISISINRQGRYLPRTGGSARINIRPFSLEVINSMQSDAAYHAMTITMENARTLVANTKWREAMKRAGQQSALDEITKMLRRTQGLISDQSIIELTASGLLGTTGKSILSARISGGLVQTASVPAAVEFIDKKYLAQIDVPTRKDIQHLKDISPVVWMRWEAKQFDYALGMVGAQNAFETLLFEHRPLTDKLLDPYTVGDEVAITKLFMAAEKQIEAETNLKRGTNEFQTASLELLYQAMNTQPQWDMLHRSPLTSDPSIFARSISMFMSARNAQYNVLVRAMDDYRKGRITRGQLSERLAGVGMANLFVSVARHTFKTAIKAGAIAVFTAIGLRKAPDEEEIKEEIVRLGKKIPLETVFNIVGLNALGTLFTSMGYAALKTRKYGWGMGRYSDIRTGNMMADLVLDFMQLGIDFTMFTDQIISGEEYETGKNSGRYKWEITGMRLIDDIALLIAYRFGLPYEGPKSDIVWPIEAALPEDKKGIIRAKVRRKSP